MEDASGHVDHLLCVARYKRTGTLLITRDGGGGWTKL